VAFEKFRILEKETQNIIPDSHKSTGKKSYGLFSKGSNNNDDVTSTGYGIEINFLTQTVYLVLFFNSSF
jgi:hypothetical protein